MKLIYTYDEDIPAISLRIMPADSDQLRLLTQ
jgi:hypothetical protein